MTTTQQPQPPTEAQPNIPATDYETIRAIVAEWSPAMRANLIYDLANTLVKQIDEAKPRRSTLQQALGLASNGGPAPTDKEVEQIIEEARMEKYG